MCITAFVGGRGRDKKEPTVKELIWAILFTKRLWTLSNSLQSKLVWAYTNE